MVFPSEIQYSRFGQNSYMNKISFIYVISWQKIKVTSF
jgi:hypothetical protein